jgi:hypothetical protein
MKFRGGSQGGIASSLTLPSDYTFQPVVDENCASRNPEGRKTWLISLVVIADLPSKLLLQSKTNGKKIWTLHNLNEGKHVSI